MMPEAMMSPSATEINRQQTLAIGKVHADRWCDDGMIQADQELAKLIAS
jgi:hypothetical protein